MRSPPPRNANKIGMSRRELEWEAKALVRDFPGDQQRMAQALADMVVSLILKNNAELARLGTGGESREDEGHR